MIAFRVGLFLTGFLGSLYALIGLFNTLPDVGIGMAVAAASVLGWGLCDWMEEQR